MNKPTLEQLKEYIFNKEKRFLCDTSFCGCKDGYCPKYDCHCLDLLDKYSNNKWLKAMKNVDNNKCCSIDDYAN